MLTTSIKITLKMLYSPVQHVWRNRNILYIHSSRWSQIQSSHSLTLKTVGKICRRTTTCLTWSKYTGRLLYSRWCQIQSTHSLTLKTVDNICKSNVENVAQSCSYNMFAMIKIYCMLTLQMMSDAVISFMDIEKCWLHL